MRTTTAITSLKRNVFLCSLNFVHVYILFTGALSMHFFIDKGSEHRDGCIFNRDIK